MYLYLLEMKQLSPIVANTDISVGGKISWDSTVLITFLFLGDVQKWDIYQGLNDNSHFADIYESSETE